MKKNRIIQLLVTLPLIGFALPYNTTLRTTNFATKDFPYYQAEDTSEISIAESKILFLDNDTSLSVKLTNNKEDSTHSNSGASTEYKDVDVEIVENDEGTKLIVRKEGDTVQHFEMNFDNFENTQSAQNDDFRNDKKEKTFTFKKAKKQRFKGHWSGLEVGLNNYLTSDNELSPNEAYMEINTGKSWNYNFNFAQVSIPLFRDKVGIVSGLGFEWSNYHFSNDNTITKDTQNRTIIPKDLTSLALKKNRLQTTYLTAPLLLEAQLGKRSNKQVAISAGIIAGLKVTSHTKYKTSDNKQKDKDDFYLNSFRYGFTARIHYNDIGLYLNYYNTPLFMNDRGPELYPLAAGLIFSFD